ncbi:MAG: hypothetical protein ACI828_002598 [Flavobacteriales bacterium]|jgi:hypothetical protein
MTVKTILAELLALQNSFPKDFPDGIFPSYRYHALVKFYRRADDNVYFTAFVLLTLNKLLPYFDRANKDIALKIIELGEKGLLNYKNRFGDVTYNFYRSDGYFPNGFLLSKFKQFQPTDDADDTAIAYRAKTHSKTDARNAKDQLIRLSNCKRERLLNRGPHIYRNFQAYNTWIGTDTLYVDLDFCVITNVLIFNAKYDLGMVMEDIESIKYLEKSILNGDYLDKKWGLNAWYPFDAVILYQVSELVETGYYDLDQSVITKLLKDTERLYADCENSFAKILLDIALWRMKSSHKSTLSDASIDDSFINSVTKSFSYGVIPLLHRIDGTFLQKMGNNRFFQLRYECRAQILALLLEWKTIKLV